MICVLCFCIQYIFAASGKCATGELIISDTTSIDDHQYDGCSGLTGSLKLPTTLISIGQYAFRSCSGLTGDLVIPNSVTNIGSNAFEGCTGFTGILQLPDSLKTIDEYSFSRCSRLTGNVIIPNSVNFLGSNAFEGCTGFNGQLVLSDKLAKIGEFAFHSCNNLAGVLNIPSNLESIGQNAFVNTKFDLVTFYGTSLQCDNTVFDKEPKCEVSEAFLNHTLCGLTITSRKENSPKGSSLSAGLIVVIVLGSLFIAHFVIIAIVLNIRSKITKLENSISETIGPNSTDDTGGRGNSHHTIKVCEKCHGKCGLCFGMHNDHIFHAHICENHIQKSQINLNCCYFCGKSLPNKVEYYLLRLCAQCEKLCESPCMYCHLEDKNQLIEHEIQLKLVNIKQPMTA